MAYIIGGKGIPDYTQLLPNLIPDVIQRVGLYIEFPNVTNHPDNSPLKQLLQIVDADTLAKGLALRIVGVTSTEDTLEIPTAKVYGNRTIYGPPVLNQPTSMTVTFVETRAPSPRDVMIVWARTVSDWFNGISWHYVPPELQATIHYYVFTPDLRFIERKETFYGAYPSAPPSDPINANVSDTELVTFNQEFRFSFKKIENPDKPATDDPIAKAIIDTIYPNQTNQGAGVGA